MCGMEPDKVIRLRSTLDTFFSAEISPFCFFLFSKPQSSSGLHVWHTEEQRSAFNSSCTPLSRSSRGFSLQGVLTPLFMRPSALPLAFSPLWLCMCVYRADSVRRRCPLRRRRRRFKCDEGEMGRRALVIPKMRPGK